MNRILRVAQREYAETVKTKTFIIGVLMAPVLIGGIIFFANRTSGGTTGPRPAIKVRVTDLSNELSSEIRSSFERHNQSHPEAQILLDQLDAASDPTTAQQEGKKKLRQGGLGAYVVLDKNVIDGTGKMHLYTYKPKATNVDALWTVENLVNKAIVNRRCQLQNLDPEMLTRLRHVPVERVEVGATEGEEDVEGEGARAARMMVPFFFMYLIFMGMIGTGQYMIGSVIEEKGRRIIEVLLSAMSPFELMAGKILGLGAIGLTATGLWAAAAYMAARWQGLNIEVTASLVVYFVIFYILGFLLLTSLLAGVGSVCNTLKETQSLRMPIMLVFILPLIAWFKLVQNPNGMLARVLSFVPPLTPLVMVLRVSASPDVWIGEIILSMILLSAVVLATIWAAAKVFRTGILMCGKRPSVREVFRWLRQS
jgi:ABC-2 type transport system permease protein